MVLKDRETLSTDGAIVCGIVLDFKTKDLIGDQMFKVEVLSI